MFIQWFANFLEEILILGIDFDKKFDLSIDFAKSIFNMKSTYIIKFLVQFHFSVLLYNKKCFTVVCEKKIKKY